MRIPCDVTFTYTYISYDAAARVHNYRFEQSGAHDHVAAQAAHVSVAERSQIHSALTSAPRGQSRVEVIRDLTRVALPGSRTHSLRAISRILASEASAALPATLAEQARLMTSTPEILFTSDGPWTLVFGAMPLLAYARQQVASGTHIACCADSTRDMFKFSQPDERTSAMELHVTAITMKAGGHWWALLVALSTQITTEVYELIFRTFLQHNRSESRLFVSHRNNPNIVH